MPAQVLPAVTSLVYKVRYDHCIVYLNQKHPWCKKSCGQELKGLDTKEVKSKIGSQGLCSATTDQNKILIITSQAAKNYVIITC